MYDYKRLLMFVNAQEVKWTPEISIQLKQISDLSFTSDGGKIAMVVRKALIEEEDSEFSNQIWISNLDESEITKFTQNKNLDGYVSVSPLSIDNEKKIKKGRQGTQIASMIVIE